jgi:dihydroorotase
MSQALLIRGGQLVDPKNKVNGKADILLADGRVAEVGPKVSAPSDARVIDAAGKWVFPGFIDLHVHFREPGEEGKETILTGSRSAVAGGFTSVVAMPNTKPVNDGAFVTRLMLERAREANLCRLYPAGAISKGLKGEELADMGELVSSGCVCITDDGRPIMSAGLMRRALQYAQIFDIPVMVHEEDLTLSSKGSMNEGPRATRMGLLPIPPSAEIAMVARDLVLLEETGGRLHIAHASCEGTVRLIRDAKKRGLRVTAEAAPHHFTLTDEAVEGYNTFAKMNPPLRSSRDVDAIRQGLADGTIDAIATDHAPHGTLDKACEFDCAANGIIGLQTALPLTLELVRAGILSLDRAVALYTSGPAAAFGLPGGHLGVGAPADVAIVDPDVEWKIDAQAFFSKSRNTPYQGRAAKGKVRATIVAGRVVFEGEEIRA